MKKYSRFNALCVLSENIRKKFAGKAGEYAAEPAKPAGKPAVRHEEPEDWAGSINYLASQAFKEAVRDGECPLEHLVKTFRWPFRSSVISVLENVIATDNRVVEYIRTLPSAYALVQVGMMWLGEDLHMLQKEHVKYYREYRNREKYKWVSKHGVAAALEELVRTSRWFVNKGREIPKACRHRYVMLVLLVRRVILGYSPE